MWWKVYVAGVYNSGFNTPSLAEAQCVELRALCSDSITITMVSFLGDVTSF